MSVKVNCLWNDKIYNFIFKSTSIILTNNTTILNNNTNDDLIEIFYNDISNIQIKNTDKNDRPKYFIKILYKGDKSIIIEFNSINLRELVKSILLCNTNNTSNSLSNNTNNSLHNKSFYFIFKNNQIFMDIFIHINKPLDLFYNIYKTSRFFTNTNNTNTNVSNNTINNEFDILLDKHMSLYYNTDTSNFNNINKKTFTMENSTYEVKERKIERKEINFKPFDIFIGNTNTKIDIQNDKNTNIQNDNNINNTNKLYNDNNIISFIDYINNKYNANNYILYREPVYVDFDSCDLETAREFCRLLCSKKQDINKITNKNNNTIINSDILKEYEEIKNKAMEFCKEFKSMVAGKYGEEAIKYITTILPETFI